MSTKNSPLDSDLLVEHIYSAMKTVHMLTVSLIEQQEFVLKSDEYSDEEKIKSTGAIEGLVCAHSLMKNMLDQGIEASIAGETVAEMNIRLKAVNKENHLGPGISVNPDIMPGLKNLQ